MLLKWHIVRRAIWLLSHREITLERGLLVTSSFPGRAHFALVFPFVSIGLVIAECDYYSLLRQRRHFVEWSTQERGIPRGKNSRSENAGA